VAWYLFYRNDTGDLVSEGDAIPAGLDTNIYTALDVGTRPNWSLKSWNPTTHQVFDTPLPLIIDRMDDIQQRLLNDPDFITVWNGLNATRKQQLRTGMNRIFSILLGASRFRQEDEKFEVG